MKKQISKYIYLVFFIIALVAVGFGLVLLSPQAISIIISLGYLVFLIATKTTSIFDKELFIIRYEKAFFLLVFLIVANIQFTVNDALRSIPLFLMVLIFLDLSYLIFSWVYEKIKIIRELRNEKLQSELSVLKSQVNPHFFFNTLNNLYGLAIEKSEDTPKVILKLSEMMRYTIYDGKKDNVTLQDEVMFLKNFIDLHKIRHHNNLKVTFTDDLKNPRNKIAPLLLINLVENAFKHGAEKLEKDAFVNISITNAGALLQLIVENNFDYNTTTIEGIGLKNLRRRLSLLYPQTHDLQISIKENTYRAELSINLGL